MKTTYRKSPPANLFQLSNVIFDPCFKVQLSSHIEKAYYIPYYCSIGFVLHFMVKLPPFLLNTQREINTVAVVLFISSNKEGQ